MSTWSIIVVFLACTNPADKWTCYPGPDNRPNILSLGNFPSKEKCEETRNQIFSITDSFQHVAHTIQCVRNS